jgi:hypothetical protein
MHQPRMLMQECHDCIRISGELIKTSQATKFSVSYMIPKVNDNPPCGKPITTIKHEAPDRMVKRKSDVEVPFNSWSIMNHEFIPDGHHEEQSAHPLHLK